MKVFSLTPRWMASDLEDPAEAATFAEVALSVEGEALAQLEDPDTGTQYAGAFLPALPLALGLAQRWWRLLYEPEKRSERRVEARHRLDVLCPGYVFPPLALWSGGDVVMARLLTPDLRFQRQRFVTPERAEPWCLPRQAVEESLAGFVAAVLSRLPASSGEELLEVWQRVTASRADPEEAAWCMAAGRLGFDPYDAATPDLESLAGSLSGELFAELSEAATLDEIPAARVWIESRQRQLSAAPRIDIGGLGEFPSSEPDDHPAHQGYNAALKLRQALGRKHPREVLAELTDDRTFESDAGPRAVQGIAHRHNGKMSTVIRAKDEEQYRFRLFHGVFLAWEGRSGEDRLISTAKTRRQQAARAFAAEMLAPAELLSDRTGSQRPTISQLESWALDFGTTPHVVQEQLWNRLRLKARIPG